MSKSVLLLLLTCLAPASLVAQTQVVPCPTADFSLYLEIRECTIGQFTFKDFTFNVPAFGGINPAGPGAFNITPIATPGAVSLGIFSNAFSVQGSEFVTYQFGYTVDPPPIIIRGVEDELFTNTPVSPGFARVRTDVCVNQAFGRAGVCGDLLLNFDVFHLGLPSGDVKLRDGVTFAPTNVVGVRKFFELNANGASASISGVVSGATLVPEPGALLLGGSGLAAMLALVGRRRRRGGVGGV